MTGIHVQSLTEEDWARFRAIRLAALEESPEAFVAGLAEEQAYDEELWRLRMRRAQRMVADVDGDAVGVVSVGVLEDAENTAEIFGLWVRPDLRGRGVAATLVRSASQQAADDGFDRIAYWVGTDNGRAVAFASGFGFRPTGRRRPMRVSLGGDDEEEIAMVLPLAEDRSAS
ncbi:GNAT family N-acetyltransferase [Nostocoides sp.]|jgi:ribosomal protein S18 acetylase RimI-like enzyme|uniref:GNAT family N-acetyltransferase n=1 Tax=Nostocoides sp. TaxID=1917966 RepID=UPI002C42774A|nr:GNAT family N-acetyltransferase [Tetrasphaera sp.]